MQSNNISSIGKKIVLIFAVSTFVFIGAIVLLSSMMTASAEPQTPSGGGWTAVFEDGFEGDISSNWVVSQTAGSGEHYWATTNYTQTEGTQSVWATGGGTDGSLLTPGTDDYPSGVIASMTLSNSVDLTGTTNVRLSFDYWVDVNSGDRLEVGVSTDGSTFTLVDTLDEDSNGWQSKTVDLNNYAGETEVWLDFVFNSDLDAFVGKGVFIDNIVLESLTEQLVYLPIVKLDPTPTPTATPAYSYFDDFSEQNGTWPVVDNTHVSNDCFKWFYANGNYNVDICDDRTDVKTSPLVRLPNGDYEIEVDAKWRTSGVWWDSYGILFDAKDDPNPNNSDLGDYYMLWVLWQGEDSVLYKILKDVPGDQEDLFPWIELHSDKYNYGSNGTEWNHWKIVRTTNTISIYLNGQFLKSVNEPRPTTNYQYLFGLYAATYETYPVKFAFDNYLVRERSTLSSSSPYAAFSIDSHPYVISGEFALDEFLPTNGE